MGVCQLTPDQIRHLRQQLGLSQAGLADRIRDVNPLLKTDRNAVSRYERGVRTPDVHVAAALERISADDANDEADYLTRMSLGPDPDMPD